MKGPTYLSQPNIQRLPILLKEIQDGQIRIPRFQRPFVWADEQRLLLFQSIYESMPIGGILVWRTREHDLRSYESLGPFPLHRRSQEKEGEDVKQYLLDGHQRLTTLYAALAQGLLSEEAAAAEEGARATSSISEDDENWPVYFDLEEKNFELWHKRGEVPRYWLPLSILLDPYELYEFQKKSLEIGAGRTLMNRAEALASTFKDYSIPVVPIVTEDLELVTESFQRINSAGTRMDQVHMISALTWSPDFDLNERMVEIRADLGEVGWEELEEKMILNTCKAALGLDIYRSEAKAIQGALKERPSVLEEATSYLKEAAVFLKDRCRVFGPGTLPYSFQVVLLADAIRVGTGNLTKPLDAELAEDLEKWFWLTTYTEYFASMSSTRLRKAREHLQCVVTQRIDAKPPDLPSKVGTIRRFDFRAARSRAMALRMAELQSRETEMEPTDLNPYRLLAEHGRNATPMLIPSRVINDRRVAEGAENRIVVHPMDAANLRRQLRDDALSCEKKLLLSHAIEPSAAEALAANDVKRFLALRRRSLIEIERTFIEQLGLEYFTD